MMWAARRSPTHAISCSNVEVLKHDLAHLSTWGLPFIILWTAGG